MQLQDHFILPAKDLQEAISRAYSKPTSKKHRLIGEKYKKASEKHMTWGETMEKPEESAKIQDVELITPPEDSPLVHPSGGDLGEAKKTRKKKSIPSPLVV